MKGLHINLFLIILLVTYTNPVSAQYANVMIGDSFPEKTYYPNEPSIAINPKNTNQMIVTTNGPVDNYYYTEDTGITWSQAGSYSFDLGLWGDPCVIPDTSANFYFFHLERLQTQNGLQMPDRIYCRKIEGDNLGDDWSQVSYTGFSQSKMQDKEWGVWDPATNNLYVVWSEFDVYGSNDSNHFSNILFSRSSDGGTSWSDPMRINRTPGDCLDGSNSVMGAMPAVGPNGEIYVSWPGPEGIAFDRSINQGITWLKDDIIVADNPAGDHYTISGISRGGSVPTIVCDLSNGPHHGTIYINWSDQVNGPNDTDIWLSKSTDGGNSWSQPKRVNDDPSGKHQMFHWMTVDPNSGYLYFVFYDRRNYNDDRTDVYIAVSSDGGESFSNHRVSESPFIPYGWKFMGDYSNIAAIDGIIRPVWARMDDGNVSVWTALIDSELSAENEEIKVPENFGIDIIYPNPFNPLTTIAFEIPKESAVSLKIFNILGKEIKSLVVGYRKVGQHKVIWDAIDNSGDQVGGGTYFCQLKAGDFIQTKKIVLLK